MKHRLRNLFGFVALLPLLLSNCALEDYSSDDLPNWTSTLELPLIATTVSLRTLLDDSLIVTLPTWDGDSIYAYQDTLEMEEIQVGDELRLDPTDEDFIHIATDIGLTIGDTSSVGYDEVGLEDIGEQVVAEVGLITMDNIDPFSSDPVPFRQLMPQDLVEDLETMLADSGGSAHVIIDPVTLEPVESEFAFESFNELNLASGWLDVTIANDMFIYLGLPLTVTVSDTSGVELFSIPWSEEIAPGTESTSSVDMTGRTLPGALLLEITGSSSGTQGEAVQISDADLDEGFTIVMEARDFLAQSVWAQIPSQTISGAELIALPASETIIEEALLESCTLTIDLTNGMDLTGDLLITIPSLVSGVGDPWEVTLPLPPSTDQYQESLSGWHLQMELANQEIEFTYQIVTDDTSPEFAHLASDDNATLELLISDITFREITGHIAQQVISDVKEMQLDTDTRIQSALVESGILAVTVMNSIGGNMVVDLTIPELRLGGVELNTQLPVVPGFQVFQMDITGYRLEPPSLDEQVISFETVTTTGTDYGEYHLTENARHSLAFVNIIFSEITGDFSETELVRQDSISTDSEHIIEHAGVLRGSVTVALENETGVPAEVDLLIEELTLAGVPFSETYLVPPDPSGFSQEVVLDGYRLQLPADRQFIDYHSIMRIPTDEIITLFKQDSLNGVVSIDSLFFSDLTGTVNGLTMESDTTSEAVDLLPEELEGIRFNNVDMSIALETDIGEMDNDDLDIMLSLGVRAISHEGEEVLSLINDWNILDSTRVVVPNATDMVNLLPERFETWGTAVINGHAIINASEYMDVDLEISLPFEFEIQEDATIDLEPELLDEGIPEELAEVLLMLNVANQFSFGTRFTVLAAEDSSSLSNGTADTLVTFDIDPRSVKSDSIRLADEKMELLIGDSTWLKGRLDIQGLEDSSGDPLMTRILASDSMDVDLHGRFRFHIDPGDE